MALSTPPRDGGRGKLERPMTDRDPNRCPLCEQPNACGAAGGASTCWCFTVTIPADVLAKIPEADRGTRCVCAACVSASAPAAAAGESGDRR